MRRRDMRRLFVYSQDGMGLGHLRRTLNIAAEVVERVPGCSVLVVSDSPAVPFFAPVPGVDHLKLPTIVKTDGARWRTGGLTLAVEDTLRLRTGLISQAFDDFRPDAVLVDHMPTGALGELKPLLDRAARRGGPRLFLGLRDVLDEPGVIRQAWSELDAYSYLERYDEVLLYGDPAIFDVAEAYGLHRHARSIVPCGYVTSTLSPPYVTPVPREPFVLVTGGGGADAFANAAAFLDALPRVLCERDLRAVILPGPNMPDSERRLLAAKAAPYPVEVGIGYEDSATLLRRSSAAVTMAGYNTLCEVLRERRPALAVPRSGPSREQRIRARLFAARRLLRLLEPEALTPERLAADLLSLLDDDGLPDAESIPAMDGARRAATLIVDGTRARHGELALMSEA